MKFSSFLILPFVAASVSAVSVRYSTVYDDPTYSTLNVACSDGKNGLYTKGYPTLGSLPKFPYVGGFTVSTWNSTACGNCYKLNYGGRSVAVTAVDATGDGFVISKTAMDALTGGKAYELGRVTVSFAQTNPKDCGF